MSRRSRFPSRIVGLPGVEAVIEKVEDIHVITGFGVMVTPALAVDGEVQVVGKVPTVAEIKQLLQ